MGVGVGGWNQNDWGGFLLKTCLNMKTLSWELLQANVTTGIFSDWILPDRGKPELGLAEHRAQRQEEKQESLSPHMFSLQAESPTMTWKERTCSQHTCAVRKE